VSEAGLGSTISLRERSFRSAGGEERLPKWFFVSLAFHLILIVAMFLAPMWPTTARPAPEATVVDLVGGERIGAANFGTELSAPKKAVKTREEPPPAAVKRDETPAPAVKKELKKEEPVKEAKAKTKEIEKKPPPPEEKLPSREKAKTETVKSEPARDVRKETSKEEAKTESASAESVRERLIQGAVERAKTRSESAQSSKGEPLSAGSGEGIGAAALGTGGRGGPGVVKGIDFIIYQNRMLATIKENWAWAGQQRSNLRVVVYFGIKENGEVTGLRIVQPSGDPSYDESVLRAVKKSSPLAAPPENYRKDFADVEITFRPQDLGA
jgi:colicin import membrane protein